jgi:hypothetical protein
MKKIGMPAIDAFLFTGVGLAPGGGGKKKTPKKSCCKKGSCCNKNNSKTAGI